MTAAKRLTSTEMSAEFYRAALDLSQAHTGRKVLEALRFLTVQRFALTPHHDQEAA
jgi:hypothetical protein